MTHRSASERQPSRRNTLDRNRRARRFRRGNRPGSPEGRRRLLLESLEQRQLLAVDITSFVPGSDITFTGDIGGTSDDHVRLSVDPNDNLLVHNLLSDGIAGNGDYASDKDFDPSAAVFEVTANPPGSGTTPFIFNLLGGNDSLTIEGLIRPAFEYHGGLGTDTLRLTGDSGGADGTYTPATSSDINNGYDGTLNYSDGVNTQTITFTGLEPIEDLIVAASLTVLDAGGADEMNFVPGPTSTGLDPITGNTEPTYQVNFGANPFELINFRNKATVTLDGLAGNDTLTLNQPTLLGDSLANISLLGGAGEDDVTVSDSTATVSIDTQGDDDTITVTGFSGPGMLVDGGGQTSQDVLNVDAGGGDLTLDLATGITVDGGPPIGPVNIEQFNFIDVADFTGIGTGADEEAILTGNSDPNFNATVWVDNTLDNVIDPTAPEINLDAESASLIGLGGMDRVFINEALDGLPTFSGQAPGAHANDAFLDDTGLALSDVGLFIDGSDGLDRIGLNLSAANHSVGYYSDDIQSANSGNLVVDTTLAIAFSNIAPIDFFGAGSGSTLTLDATSTPATTFLSIDDDVNFGGPYDVLFGPAAANDGVTAVWGDGGFETSRFLNYGTVIVRSGTGSETINLLGLDVGAGSPLSNITLDGDNTTSTDTAADLINIDTLPAAVTATVTGGAGNDTIQIAPFTQSLDGVQGPINVQGEANDAAPTGSESVTAKGTTITNTLPVGDTLRVNDSQDTDANTYTLNDGSVARSGSSTISYGTVETLELLASSTASNNIDILDTTDASSTLVTGGGDADDVDITTTGAGSILVVTTLGDNDDVDVTNTGDNSVLRVDAGPGADDVTVQETGASAGLAINGGSGGDTINIVNTGTDAVVAIDGMSGDDDVNVDALPAGGLMDIFGGDGNDDVTLGYISQTLDLFLGEVCVFGEADDDTLTINDSADADDNNYIVRPDSVERTNAAPAVTVLYESTEELTLLAGTGSDKVVAEPSTETTYILDGGLPTGPYGSMPGDTLSVNTVGFGPVDAPFQQTAGVISSPGGAFEPITFSDFEWVVLPDRFEYNDNANGFPDPNLADLSTKLGSLPEITLDRLSIHGPDDPDTQVVEDTDYFQYTANATGKLIINALFEHEFGDLEMTVLDADGDIIATSNSSSDDQDYERIIIPVVSQEIYYIQVNGVSTEEDDCNVNNYVLEIENFAAPVPVGVTLSPQSDTGRSNLDHTTSPPLVTVPGADNLLTVVSADLSDFAAMGIPILSAADAAAGDVPGAAVEVFVDGVSVGFADVIAGSDNAEFSFVVDTTAAPINGNDGSYLLQGAVRIFDGADTTATGRSRQSETTLIVLDGTAPMPPTLNLLASSDTNLLDGITRINQPAYAGTAEPNSRVTLLADGDAVGTTFADSTGQWEITSEPLADGTYAITAVAEDLAGNVSAAADGGEITIDTTFPQRPTIDLQNSDDTGWSEFDNITIGDPTQAPNVMDFVITAEAGASVVVKDGNTVIGTIPVMPAASVTLTLNLTDGTHLLSTEVTDTAGNVSHQSEELVVEVDTQAPAPSAVTLAPYSDTGVVGDNITSERQPAFVGTAEANARIHLLANGTLIGTAVVQSDESDGDDTNGLGIWELTSEPLADGDYEIIALVEDVAGNFSDPNEVPLRLSIVGEGPQRPTIDLVNSDDTGSSEFDNITIGDPDVLPQTQVADFRISADPGTNVVIKDGNTVINAYITDGGGGVLATPAPFNALDAADGSVDGFATIRIDFAASQLGTNIPAEGAHPLSVEATDVAGNRSLQSDELLVEIDTTAPGTPLSQFLAPSSDTGTVGDDITSKMQPVITGIAEANAVIRIYANNILVGEGRVGSDESDVSVGGPANNGLGIFEVTLEPLVDGEYLIETEVEDQAGNVSGRSTAVDPLVIDGTPPQFPSIDLVNSNDTGWSDMDNVTIGDPTAVPGQVNLRITGEPGSTAVLKDGDTVIGAPFVIPPSGIAIRTTNLAEGPHPLTSEVTDLAGNRTQSEQLLVHIDFTPPAPTTPDLAAYSDTGASDTDNVTSTTQPAFLGTAEANARVHVFANGELIGTAVVQSDESDGDDTNGLGIWELTSEPLADGDYVITTAVEDQAGNFSEAGQALEITIDTTFPQRPTIDLVNSDDTGWSEFDNITIGDPNAGPGQQLTYRITGEPGSSVVVKDGDAVIGGPFLMPAGGVVFFTANFTEGPHPLTSETTDAAGNRTQSEQLLVEVDFTAPLPSTPALAPYSDTGVLGDGVTSKMQPAFVGTAEANARIHLFANGVLIGTAVVQSDESDGDDTDGLGLWELTSEPLADGDYRITAVVEDIAGNLSEAGEPLAITIDSQGPQRPTIDLVNVGDTGLSEFDNITIGDLTTPGLGPAIVQFRITGDPGETFVVKDGNIDITTVPGVDLPDGNVIPADGDTIITVDYILVGGFTSYPSDGPHPMSVELLDAAGNVSAQSEELLVEIDTMAPAPSSIELLDASDTNIVGDLITSKMQPAFFGLAEANAKVHIAANGEFVGTGFVQSDESDGDPSNGLGIWEITVEPLADGDYTVLVVIEDVAGNFSDVDETSVLDITIDGTPPQIPTIDLVNSDDTGSSDLDNVTIGDPGSLPQTQVADFRISAEAGTTVVIKDGETVIDTIPNFLPGPGGFAIVTIDFAANQGAFGIPAEGPHPLTVETTDTAGNFTQSEQLLVEIDTTAPAASDPALALTSDSNAIDGTTNIRQPAIVGTAEANAKIHILANGTFVGTGFVQSDESDGDPNNGLGIWEITLEPLVDGSYTILTLVEDLAGNFSDFGEPLEIVIDGTQPQIPTIDLINEDDTGSSDSDNLTIGDPDVFPTTQVADFRISAEAGTDVVIKDGEVVIETINNFTPGPDGFAIVRIDFAANEGAFGISAEGPHPLTIEATDTAGNFTQSEQLLVTIDSTPPDPSDPALAPYSDTGILGDGITSKMQPAFIGVAEANAKIHVFATRLPNGQPALAGTGFVQSDESDGDPTNGLGIWEITLEPLADGDYFIQTLVEDLAGNFSDAGEALEITIDSTLPQIPTIDLVDTDDTGSSDLDNVTIGDPDALPQTQVADFRISAEPGADVVIKDGEVVIATINDFTPDADGFAIVRIDFAANELAFDIPAEGPHPLTIEATDAAGNFRQSEQLLVTIDTTPPDPPSAPDLLSSSDSGESDTDNITNKMQPAFNGTGEANAIVRIFARKLDATGLPIGPLELIGLGTVGSDESDLDPTNGLGIWEITVEPLVDSRYEITAELEDLAGNISLLSEAILVTIDSSLPQVPTIDLVDSDDTGSSDLDNVTIGDPEALPQTQVADFRISAEFGSEVVVKDGNTIVDSFTFDNIFDLSDGVLDGFGIRRIDFALNEVIFNIPAEGPHPLTVESTDTAGNFRQSEQLLVTIDTTAPDDASITIDLKPTSDDGIPGDNATTIRTPGFVGLAEANAKYRLYANGTLVAEGVVGSDESDGDPNNGLGIWDPGVTALAYDDYFVTIEVEDLAGNITQASDFEYIVVDPYEINDTIPEATVLGSLKKITKNDVILHNREDVDVWKYTAQDTGKLILNVHFPHQAGNIDLDVLDMDGNVIMTAESVTDNEQIIIPVVSQEMYFIQVRGEQGLYTVSRDPGGLDMPQLRRIDTALDPAGDLEAPLVINLAGETVLEANALARHPATGQLFALLTLQGQVGRELVTLDPNTGDATSIGNTGDLFKDLAFDASGILYGVTDVDAVGLQPEGLFTLNQTNATPTLVTALAPNAVGEAIGFNPLDGNLYRMSGLTDFAVVDNRLYSQIDLATLVETPIGLTFPSAGPAPVGDEYDQIESLTFDPLSGGFVAGALDGFMYSVAAPPVNPIGGLVPAGTVTLLTNLNDIATGAAYAFDRGIYDLEIENFEAPVPSAVVLDPNDDSGMMNNDLITFVDDARVYIIADLEDFADMGIEILDPSEIADGDPGAAVEVFANGDSVGFATPVGSSTTLFSFDFDPAGIVNGAFSEEIPITGGTAVALANQGYFNIITSAVRIFDGQEDQATGRRTMSESLNVHFDPNAPDIDLATINLLDASDSGHTDDDNITHINQPAFSGVAEENTKVRLYANGELVGQSVVNSDNSDGVPNDGLGVWEITVEPLVDGDYEITLELEDVAGNVSERSDVLVVITVDTLGPQRPTIDLVGVDVVDPDKLGVAPIPSDTGLNTMDNNTRGFARDEAAGTAQVQVRVSAEPGGIVVIKDGENPIDSFEMPSTITTTFDLSGAEQVPPNGSPATGTATITLDVHTGDFTWDVSYTPLDGVFTVAHFHGPAPKGLNAPIEVPITATVNPVTRTAAGNAVLTAEQIADLLAGQWYLNIHSTAYPAGEIRGQVLYSPANDFIFRTLTLDEDPHPLSVEVFDWAGNRSAQSEELLVTIDITPPDAPTTPDLLASSDSGMVDTDNVTNVDAPAFRGIGEANSLVRVFARQLDDNGDPITGDYLLIGQGVVGSDESDDPQDTQPDDELGIWEVTVEPLADGRYEITAELEDKYGNISVLSEDLEIEIDTEAPNTPYLDLIAASDTGRNDEDNVTNDNTLTFTMTSQDRTTDPTEYDHLFDTNFKFRIFVRPEAAAGGVTGEELLIYDSTVDPTIPPADILDGLTSLNFLERTMIPLPDGFHNFKLEVEDRAGNISKDFLLNVIIDTEAFEGDANLHPDSDSGIWGFPATMSDRITMDKVPSFFGTAEANNIVTVAIDGVPAGTTVAVPLDGNDAFQPPNAPYQGVEGNWEIDTVLNLADGLHSAVFTFEDLAGNRETTPPLLFFVDTEGPRIENVTFGEVSVDGNFFFDGETSLFEPKPAGGPDPLVHSIVIHYSDGPNRVNPFLYGPVFQALALEEGNYSVVGDANGNIPITEVNLVNEFTGPGRATAQYELVFGVPLPDDRFTVTVSDSIKDVAGNSLDGESGAAAPFDGNDVPLTTPPIFPTGDGEHGGEFVARFTIDSRAELAVWGAGSVWADTNGNFFFDPDNVDYVNRDIVYTMGITSDDVFAGNFSGPGPDGIFGTQDDNNDAFVAGDAIADGFDKLAAWGDVGVAGSPSFNFRWLIDNDNDGRPDLVVDDPNVVDGFPVAGSFDGSVLNGDEVGLFTGGGLTGGGTWHFDTNHDFILDTQVTIPGMIGLPIVGDFNNDGLDDLGTWSNDFFHISLAGTPGGVGPLAWDPTPTSFRFGFIGQRERPIAADFDADGYDDIGLWVPDRAGATPEEISEWYILVSGGQSVLDRIEINPLSGEPVIEFIPDPFGVDIYAKFGDDFAKPVVGNFDPPSNPGGSQDEHIHQNPQNRYDVNNDGKVTPADVLMGVNDLNARSSRVLDFPNSLAPFFDVTGDGSHSPADPLAVINYLNAQQGVGEGEAPAAWTSVAEGESAGTAFVEVAVDSLAATPLEETVAVPNTLDVGLLNDGAADRAGDLLGSDLDGPVQRSSEVAVPRSDEGSQLRRTAQADAEVAVDDQLDELSESLEDAMNLEAILNDIAADVTSRQRRANVDRLFGGFEV